MERKNRVIQEMARVMLNNKSMTKLLWGEAVNTARHMFFQNIFFNLFTF